MSNISNVSLSQATSLERSLNMTAHNLANASTSGYKSINPLYESVDDGFGRNSISYVEDRGTYLDLSKGALMPTGNPLDLAVAGEGWMSFQMENGETAYSRHSRLVLDSDGQLKTSSGLPLLDVGGGPVLLPEDVGQSFRVTPDGTITDDAGAVLGQVGVFALEGADKMKPAGGGMYMLPPGAAPGQPAASADLMQGFIESSNVEAVLEMTRLIDIQRAYENAVKLMTEDNELTKQAIQRLGRTSG